jgi:hypothetical protein
MRTRPARVSFFVAVFLALLECAVSPPLPAAADDNELTLLEPTPVATQAPAEEGSLSTGPTEWKTLPDEAPADPSGAGTIPDDAPADQSGAGGTMPDDASDETANQQQLDVMPTQAGDQSAPAVRPTEVTESSADGPVSVSIGADGSDPLFDSTAAGAPASAQESDGQAVVVALAEVNGSGVTGTAALTATDGGTRIVLELSGTEQGDAAALYSGSCDALGLLPKIYLSAPDTDGRSDTLLPTDPLNALRNDFAVVVYVPQQEGGKVLACGDIPPETQAVPPSDSGGVTSTGVGTAAPRGDAALRALLALVGAAFLVAAAAVRRGARSA